MKKNALLEKLAALEHERWSGWMKHLFTHGFLNRDGSFMINADAVKWWKKLIRTKYENLKEHSKESDRIEARKTIALLKKKG